MHINQVSEERFTSLCYAGHLPGYTMGYNHHGLVYSINTLSASTLYSGKTRNYIKILPQYLQFADYNDFDCLQLFFPFILYMTIYLLFFYISLISLFVCKHLARHFITRALLSAPNFEQAQKILRDNGVGAADGCSINMTFLK